MHHFPSAVALILSCTLLALLCVPAGPARAQAAPGGGVTADVSSSSGEFVAVTPTRILDTRTGTGGLSGPLPGGSTADVQVTGLAGVPAASAVSAVVINVTATNATGPGYVTVFPAGVALPNASNVNFVPGTDVPNLVTVIVGTDGKVSLYANAYTVDLVFDITGYYSSPSGNPGGRFHGIAPRRLLDTRQTGASLWAGQARTLQIGGVTQVPYGANAVVINVTVTNPTEPGYLTVSPTGPPRPMASNVNFAPGQTVANLVTIGLPGDGRVDLYPSNGTFDVVIDLLGWYDADKYTDSGRFVPLSPTRVFDTRLTQPLGPGEVRGVGIGGGFGVPSIGVGTVMMNVTLTQPNDNSYVTVFPYGGQPPTASNVNFVAGQTVADLAVSRLGQGGLVGVFNYTGGVHAIVDVEGYFIEQTFAFDTCEAPPLSTMAAWRSGSPFSTVGIYIGGGLRACANTALGNPAWVHGAAAMGWGFIPIYVGLQAPCTTFLFRIDPGTAYSQGLVAADDAVARAQQAGLADGSPVYFDMEGYNRTVAGCSLPVQQFIAGWTDRLHAHGFRSGLYSSLSSGIVDQVGSLSLGLSVVDALWIAAWATPPNPNIYGFPNLPDGYWNNHQRLHQYVGGHNETWGGVTINIDSTVIDGPVAYGS